MSLRQREHLRNVDGRYSGTYKGREFIAWKEFDERGRPLWCARSGAIGVKADTFHMTLTSVVRGLKTEIDRAHLVR